MESEEALQTEAERREVPPVNAIIPAELTRDVAQLPDDKLPEGTSVEWAWPWQPVCIDTAEGPWVFEVMRPGNMVDEIHRRYIDESRDMYGVRLPKAQRAAATAQPQ